MSADQEQLTRLWRAFGAGLAPDPDYAVSQWADTHRMLAAETSAEPGRWRTSRTPYLRGIMDALGPQEPAQTVVVMAASQLGKSEAGNNWIGYVIDIAPGPMLMVQPTVEDAENYSKQRIAPMLAASPRLRERVPEARSRDSGNTLLTKEYAGGFLRIVGSNAPSKLASTPIRYVFLDEVDRFPADAGGEGDPVALAKQRTATFANRKILLTSTPTIEGFSRIEAAYLETDRRRYWVPCPHCDQRQVLRFRPDQSSAGGLMWPPGRPDLAAYQCEHCGAQIEHHHKTWMLERGEWRPDCESRTGAIGYWISAMYSPEGWTSWSDLAMEFVSCGKDPERLKTFVNTKLAETWKAGDGAAVKAAGLAARAERYDAEVPDGVVTLTAGVDVQDDRLEVEVVGWGAGEESWSIAWHLIAGDPSGPAVWRELDQLLLRKWERRDGSTSRIAATCIDTGGHHTQQVYHYCRGKESRRVWAVKGSDRAGQLWPKRPSYRKHASAVLYILAVNAAKESIYSRLRVDPPGAGALHFPQTHPPEYYEQLTAERIEVTRWRGREIRKWIKPSGRRNEALDCRVYAYAALHGLLASGLRLPAWSATEQPSAAAGDVTATASTSALAAASTPIDQRPSAAHTVQMPRPAPAPPPPAARRRKPSMFAELRR